MVNVTFENNYDALFMLIMIFIHDFLHDFNIVNFSERLSTIRGIIADFTAIASGEMPLRPIAAEDADIEGEGDEEQEEEDLGAFFLPDVTPPGSPRREVAEPEPVAPPPPLAAARGRTTRGRTAAEPPAAPARTGTRGTGARRTGGSSDIPILSNASMYQGFGPGETVELFKYWAKKEGKNINNFLPTDKLNVFHVKIIQEVIKIIDESQLYVLGFMGHNTKQKGGKHGSTTVQTRGHDGFVTKDDLFEKEGLDRATTFNPKAHIKRNPLQIKIVGKYDKHHDYVKNGYDTAIEKTDGKTKEYFMFMKNLFLCYEDTDKNPYETFTNVHIKNALFMYLLNENNNLFNKSNPYKLLKSLETHYRGYFENERSTIKFTDKKKFRGGDPNVFLANVKRDFDKFIPFVNDPAKPATDLFRIIEQTTDEEIDRIKSFIDRDVTDPLSDDAELKAILHTGSENYKKVYNDTIKEYTAYKGSRSGSRIAIDKKKAFLSNAKDLIVYICNSVTTHNAALSASAAAEAARAASGSLTQPQKDNVGMISIIVAEGGKQHIIGRNIDFRLVDNEARFNAAYNNNSVLRTECKIIDSVVKKREVPGTIDKAIKNAFINYAETNFPNRILKTAQQMKTLIIAKRSRKNISTINNATTKSLDLLRIDISERTCPLSSITDAQGSFGSCVSDVSRDRKEYHPMDFKITNSDETIYYEGKTSFSQRGSDINSTVSFSARVGDFVLEPSIMELSIVDGKQFVELSANTTIAKVMTKIVSIWTRLFGERPEVINDRRMWQELISTPVIFADLISCSAIKSVGDLFQEINSVAKDGGYLTASGARCPQCIPSTYFNNVFRIGANGDQPSGVRAGFILLKATPGSLIPDAMAGYLSVNKDRDNPQFNDGSFVIVTANNAVRGGGSRKLSRKVSSRKTRKYY